MKKTFLIVIWNLGIGGIQKRLKDIVNQLSIDHPNLQITLLIKQKDPNHFASSIKPSPNLSLEYAPLQNRRLSAWTFALWFSYKYFTKKPDILLTFLDHLSVQAILLKKICFWTKTRVVLNEGVLTSQYLILNRPFYWKYIVKTFYKFSDLIIVPTQAVKHDLISYFSVSDNRIIVIPNWTLFESAPHNGSKTIDLLFIGRFESEKNPIRFLEILSQLINKYPQIKAVMLGEGSLKEELKKYIKINRLDSFVELIKPSSSPQSFLIKSKILVLTTRNEGFPNVVLEAGALGIPSVITDFPGSREVIHHCQDGFRVTSNKQFIKYISLLLSDKSSRIKVGKQIQQKVRQYFSKENQNTFIQTLVTS